MAITTETSYGVFCDYGDCARCVPMGIYQNQEAAARFFQANGWRKFGGLWQCPKCQSEVEGEETRAPLFIKTVALHNSKDGSSIEFLDSIIEPTSIAVAHRGTFREHNATLVLFRDGTSRAFEEALLTELCKSNYPTGE
ncbi:hypothetical protein LCGC14_2509260 [marine sediment metagenome]|uniref:Uncharacterized protein n=1 Tax=marine sediment metagenome TaxID=412755 RepID=A0A0F9DT49_9ZZZZ